TFGRELSATRIAASSSQHLSVCPFSRGPRSRWLAHATVQIRADGTCDTTARLCRSDGTYELSSAIRHLHDDILRLWIWAIRQNGTIPIPDCRVWRVGN